MIVAACFVLAAAGEAAVVHRSAAGPVLFGIGGAPTLAVLALRRTRPLLPLAVIAVAAAFGTAVQTALWPHAGDGGGVWLFALLFAAYSFGLYGRTHTISIGTVLPMAAALAIDVPTMRGWSLVNGITFLTVFVGLLPAVVGHTIRLRRERIARLAAQQDVIVREQRSREEAAVLDERVRASERLQPALLDGLAEIARSAEDGAAAAHIEDAARRLLGRTREEVVALTAPVEVCSPGPAKSTAIDHVGMLRTAAQPWAVLGAGAIGAGLALEVTSTLPLSAPSWCAVIVSLLIAVPLGLTWWRPLVALPVAWGLAIVLSRLIAPLDGSLSGTAFTLTAAFAAGALAHRNGALAGLALCVLGQLVGIGTADPFGEATMIVVSWLGGRAVNEASRLVEQSRANTHALAEADEVARQRAVVGERLRLAREIHDQIGHTLTVVALQAGAARRLATSDATRADEVMATIARAARDGLDAMRGESLQSLPALLARTRAAGLDLRADLSGLAALEEAGTLDADIVAVTHRIVQEALTNVLRHAPGATATVTARAAGPELALVVHNTVPSGTSGGPGTGRGLGGLRERVTDVGGELTWGPDAEGGFAVHALLPCVRRLQEVPR
jgi:signal transduction histidine kinase